MESMTVRELQLILANCNPDAVIVVNNHYVESLNPVTHLNTGSWQWADSVEVEGSCVSLEIGETLPHIQFNDGPSDLGQCERCGAKATTQTLDNEVVCSECGQELENATNR